MPCSRPYPVKRVDGGIVFARTLAETEMELSCGQCMSCRVARSRDWAIRGKHEAELYPKNAFITLTFRDSEVPLEGVRRGDIKKFMKDLRNKKGAGIRFMACGEYGPLNTRPHYHLCLFNCFFEDMYAWSTNKHGQIWFRSPCLEALWPYGYSTIGELTAESAGYTARYVLKKISGEKAKLHYTSIDPVTGEIYDLQPEFIQVSNRPGLGTGWIEKHWQAVYGRDSVIHNGKEKPVPKFYDKWLAQNHPHDWEDVQKRRIDKALERNPEDSTTARLLDREAVLADRVKKQLPRVYENDA